MPVAEIHALNRIINNLDNGVLDFLNGSPIIHWRRDPEVQAAATELESVLRGSRTQLAARSAAIAGAPGAALGTTPPYNPLEGLIALNTLRNNLEPVYRKFDYAPHHVKNNRRLSRHITGNPGVAGLRTGLNQLGSDIEQGISDLMPRVREFARDHERAQLTAIQNQIIAALNQQEIRDAFNGTPPPGHNQAALLAYRQFLVEQAAVVGTRLIHTQNPGNDYSIAEGKNTFELLERNFQRFDQEVRTQHATATSNLASPFPGIVSQAQNTINSLNFTQSTYGNIFSNVQNTHAQLTSAEQAIKQANQNRHRNLRRAFRAADRWQNSVRNHAIEIGAGVATGIITKTFFAGLAFKIAAAVTTGPVGAAVVSTMILGAAVGVATRFVRDTIRIRRARSAGHTNVRRQRGWWWKSAAWGAVGGGLGYGLASYMGWSNPFSGWGNGSSGSAASASAGTGGHWWDRLFGGGHDGGQSLVPGNQHGHSLYGHGNTFVQNNTTINKYYLDGRTLNYNPFNYQNYQNYQHLNLAQNYLSANSSTYGGSSFGSPSVPQTPGFYSITPNYAAYNCIPTYPTYYAAPDVYYGGGYGGYSIGPRAPRVVEFFGLNIGGSHAHHGFFGGPSRGGFNANHFNVARGFRR